MSKRDRQQRSYYDDLWDGYDWYYWDTVRKSGKLVADAAWAEKQRRERRGLLARLFAWLDEG